MNRKLLFPAVCVLLALYAVPLFAQVQTMSSSNVDFPAKFDVSAPLRSYPPAPLTLSPRAHAAIKPKAQKLKAAGNLRGQAFNAPVGKLGPSVGLSFDGISIDPGAPATENCANIIGGQLAPPDTNSAVGDTQIVEWANICYSVYDKSTGALIAGPFAGNNFWNGFGGVCQADNDGDPIIQWDKANHVWVASQNVFGPFGTCIAVSKTADATGAYNRYFFTQPGFPDYHKFGLTPHAYWQTQNNFGTGSAYVGVTVCAYDGDALRAGSNKAKRVCMVDNSNGTLFDDSFLPADTDQDPKSAGPTPEVFLGSIDNSNPGSNVYEYVGTVSFKGKGKMSLAGVNGSMPIAVPQYSLGCGGFGACIPQPSTANGTPEVLDALGDRLMYRLAMFDDGTNQHFLVTHSVNDGAGAVGARWYEFTAPTGTTSLSLAQSGQTPADGEYRWMGSVARDTFGDIALGYSRSSANTGDFPSIYVSGQTAGEAAGTTDAEVLVWQGGGSQFATANRWGDYSSMALDGADHCTFVYSQEYYPFDGSFQWYTHLATVKFPSCP